MVATVASLVALPTRRRRARRRPQRRPSRSRDGGVFRCRDHQVGGVRGGHDARGRDVRLDLVRYRLSAKERLIAPAPPTPRAAAKETATAVAVLVELSSALTVTPVPASTYASRVLSPAT